MKPTVTQKIREHAEREYIGKWHDRSHSRQMSGDKYSPKKRESSS